MSVVPLNVARVSMQMQGSLLLGNLQSSQLGLLQVEQQLSSGQQLNLPSDDPAAAVNIVSLKQQISDSTNYSSNLKFATGILSQADSTLSSLSGLINQAQSIASSQVGTGVTADQRTAQAQVVNTLLSQALDLANTQYQGQSVFGGQTGSQNAFTGVAGGYQYQGTANAQTMLTPTGGTIQYTLTGDQAFGAISSQVVGYRNLTPALTGSTRLSDVGGAQQKGIAAGPVTLTVGATSSTIDLSGSSTVNDVLNRLNAGLTAAGSDATAAISGGSIVITGDSTQNISFADAQGGSAAANLGIAGPVATGATVTGAPLQPRITNTTPLAALNNGTGVDHSGIVITNGASTATITLAGMSTVQDLLNAINTSGTNVQASINASGTGINLVNPLSGSSLTIGENGGNTADQLGVRSYNTQTKLADLNSGAGVTPISQTVTGASGQILITKTDGTQFSVAVSGIKTPSQMIAAINGATGNGTVTAALNASGNGITLTDTSGGPGNLSVNPGTGFSANNTVLGILQNGVGGTLTGTDMTFATDDFRITRRDGSSFTVNVTGAATIQDVLNQINNADGNSAPATKVTATLNTTGNGIELTDASTGGGSLTVTAINSSGVADQLGIDKAATSATPGTINGDDTNPLQPQGIFSTLSMLRDALLNNDTAGITRAGALLTADNTRTFTAQGLVGAREQDVTSRQSDATAQQTQLTQALSLLNDTDFTTAATRLQQLQTAYQASLQVAQTTQNLSLLDFLK